MIECVRGYLARCDFPGCDRSTRHWPTCDSVAYNDLRERWRKLNTRAHNAEGELEVAQARIAELEAEVKLLKTEDERRCETCRYLVVLQEFSSDFAPYKGCAGGPRAASCAANDFCWWEAKDE